MRGSFRLGRIAGIKVFVHWTFFLLIGWIFMKPVMAGEGAGTAAMGVAFILALFACVLLHELGHALAARRYGIATRDITLLPIGGLARLERIPRNPAHELVVALAGPAVNVIIALLIFAGLWAAYRGGILAPYPMVLRGNFFVQLMAVNIFLVVFNLIPAFPMDGGRVLRALLAWRLPYVRATNLAARAGQVLAVALALFGLFVLHNPMLLLVGFFVFLGARGEAHAVRVTDTLSGMQVQDAMMTNFRVLRADDSLELAANEMVHGSQQDFPVVKGDQVIGLLTRDDLAAALATSPMRKVGEVMRPNCGVVSATDQLEKPYEMLREDNCSTVPVVREGHLVGMITLENILEWVMINSALRQRPAAG